MNIEVEGTPETLDQRHRASLCCGVVIAGGFNQMAFREVEDQLVALRTLGEQSIAVASANHSAGRALALANTRFQAGASAYLDVLEARRSVIAVQRQRKQLDGTRAQATVALIKALGGDW